MTNLNQWMQMTQIAQSNMDRNVMVQTQEPLSLRQRRRRCVRNTGVLIQFITRHLPCTTCWIADDASRPMHQQAGQEHNSGLTTPSLSSFSKNSSSTQQSKDEVNISSTLAPARMHYYMWTSEHLMFGRLTQSMMTSLKMTFTRFGHK